jgi:hypothetical protein
MQSVLGHGLCQSGDLAQVLDRPEGIARARVQITARGQGPAVAPVEVVCSDVK